MTNILLMSITSQTGGGPKNLLSILKGIDRTKYHTVTVCPNDGEYYEEFRKYSEVIAMELRQRPLSSLLKLRRIVKDRKIRLAHSHGRGAGAYTRPLKLLCPGLKEVHTFHGIHYENRGRIERKLILIAEHLLGKLSDRSICVSRKEYEEAVRLKFSDRERLRLVYNGIDVSQYDRDTDTDGLRRSLNIGCSDLTIGCVARFSDIKGHRELIGAFSRFIKDVPGAKLLLVGDGPLRQQIEDDISSRGLEASVILTGTRKDVPELLKCMDIFVSASYKEGLPYTLIEALAARVPTVATQVTGNDEIIKDGCSGVLCRARDEESLYLAMKKIYEMPEELKQNMSENGFADVRERFSEDSMVKATVLCYEEVI